MAKRRVIIGCSRPLPLNEWEKTPPFHDVEFIKTETEEGLLETLEKETINLILLDGDACRGRGAEVLKKVATVAPRTPVIFLSSGGNSPSFSFRGEVISAEVLASKGSEILEKYLFSGYGTIYERNVETLFNYCFPIITTLDYDPLCQTVLDFFREFLTGEAGFLISEQEGRGSGFRLLAVTGFPTATDVHSLLERHGRDIVEASSPEPKIVPIEDVLPPAVEELKEFSPKSLFLCTFSLEGMTPVHCAVFLRGRAIPEVALSPAVVFLHHQSCYSLYNAEKSIKVQSLIYIDDLTKLYNARYLNVVLDRELKRSDRYGVPVSILFLDIDYFKRVNDSHGHLVGSRVLCEFGAVIRGCVRETDTVVRYGGDEFVVILVETNPDQALLAAERMRRTVEEHTFMEAEGLSLHLTVSIGIATYPIHASTKEELLQMADRAMYRGKDTTRNVVYIADS
ncbi:MAG: GGDEF domain-containing protein [Deltaproteobacteria bacterium]|nr:MAG: GGDEF domain-containing protein [Deltaproteobacteria bacterium]